MKVKWFDFEAETAEIRNEIYAAFDRVVRSGQFVLGQEGQGFEAEYASFCNAKFCVGVGSGLDALHLALRALGVGPGDEVIVPAHTFIATWLSVTYCGARPVPVDVIPDSYNMDPDAFAKAIGPRTRAVIPVDLYGLPADLPRILEEAHRHDIPVVEDAAQAHGAFIAGRRVGSVADVTAFSFYPIKNLGAYGDAGAVTTNNPEIAHRIRLLGNYGSEAKYRHQLQGFNSRLDEVQAAILRVKLRRLDLWNSRRRRCADRYLKELSGNSLVLPVDKAGSHVWHVFPIRTSARDLLLRHLTARGIPAMIHYPVPPYRQEAYEALRLSPMEFPIAEQISAEVLSLPISPFLSDSEQGSVIEAIHGLPR